MARGKVFGGVDIGGTKTAVVLSSAPPGVLRRIVFPTEPANGPSPALKRIVSSMRTALFDRGLSARDSVAPQSAHVGECPDQVPPRGRIPSPLLS